MHGPYHIEAKYANGATMIIDNKFTNGIRFEGADGWIFVSRGSAKVTASDPATAFGKALDASDPQILNSKIGPNEIHLHASTDHHLRLAYQHPDPPAGGHHPRAGASLPPAPASSAGSP